MLTRKEIEMAVACRNPVPNADAIEFVKRTLNPAPPPSGGLLELDIGYAHHGGISHVMFTMCGTPTRGHALLRSDNGGLDDIHMGYRLHVERFGAKQLRLIQNPATVAMFLQVARMEADRVGFREKERHTY